jgi:hypothetical protein
MPTESADKIALKDKVLSDIVSKIIDKASLKPTSNIDAINNLTSIQMDIFSSMKAVLAASTPLTVLTTRQQTLFEFLDHATDFANAAKSGRDALKLTADLNAEATTAKNKFLSMTN